MSRVQRSPTSADGVGDRAVLVEPLGHACDCSALLAVLQILLLNSKYIM